MTRLSTKDRIFANQFFREAKRIEAKHAALISPGHTSWRGAVDALYDRMDKAGSPIKQAAILKAATAALNGIDPREAMHVGFIGGTRGKRSALLAFGTFSAGHHPLKAVNEEGLSFLKHAIACGRNSTNMQAGITTTYVSKHAVARLHERNHHLTPGSAFGIFAFAGVLGLLTRHSEKHIRGELCLLYDDVLCVGSLKHTIAHGTDGSVNDGSFLDIRTVLPATDVRDQARLDQGRIAYDAVNEWLTDRKIGRAKAITEQIPYLPRRENDYTLKMAVGA